MDKLHRHFEEEIDLLRDKTVRLGGVADAAIAKAIAAFVRRDSDLAREVIAEDEVADRLELEIDHLALEILARHAPRAGDLRFVATVMRITPELERIADLASQVCERVIELNEEPVLLDAIDVPAMGDRARAMLQRALDALVQKDAQAARQIILMDDDLDRRMQQSFRILLTLMLEDPRTITRALRLMMVAKYVERMGDQVTNIAEQVVYMVEGRMIKHMGDAGIGGAHRS
jgi:phosphate transport system protein